MTDSSEGKGPESSDAPYGTEPRRSVVALVVACVVYGLWFLLLLWMAMFKSQGWY